MRLVRPAVIAAVMVSAASCGDATGGGGGGQTCAGSGAVLTITASDNLRFSPQNPPAINVGQSVCWQNTGGLFHTVTSDDGPGNTDDGTTFGSNLSAGTIFVHTFTSSGAFPYHCIPHQSDGMVGTIDVK